ncbi:ABC transporter substrate-binding protein [uncultured Robinsoniella sp.]|uniref:ABC transporter substrate-binding protein n=1 Tax=uncultured Robinsoniella sp. TaxID=904190 RepID=UPI00374F2BE8
MKRKMKKITSVLLSGMVVMTVLSACGGAATSEDSSANTSKSGETSAKSTEKSTEKSADQGTKEEPIVLEVWSHHSDPQAQVLRELGEKYSEATGENVVVNYTEVAWDDYIGTKLTTAFAAGDGPDIFTTCPPQIARYVSAGIAMPLDDYLTEDMRNDFTPSYIEGVTFDDQVYAIPTQGELLALYYDKDVFEEAGLKPPTTWEEMIADAKQLTTQTRAGLTMRVADDSSVVFDWLPLLWSTGADIMDISAKKSLLDSQGVADSLQVYTDLMSSGALNIKPSRNADEIGILCDGETAMQICGTWAISSIEEDYPDSNIGVVPYPVQKAGDEVSSAAGGWSMVVNAQSKKAETAAKLITWAFAQDTEIPVEWCTKVSFCYPTRDSVLKEASDVYKNGLRAVFTEDIFGHEKPELRAPAEVYKILQDMIQQSMYTSDGKTAAKEAHQKLQEFLDDYDDLI